MICLINKAFATPFACKLYEVHVPLHDGDGGGMGENCGGRIIGEDVGVGGGGGLVSKCSIYENIY